MRDAFDFYCEHCEKHKIEENIRLADRLVTDWALQEDLPAPPAAPVAEAMVAVKAVSIICIGGVTFVAV